MAILLYSLLLLTFRKCIISLALARPLKPISIVQFTLLVVVLNLNLCMISGSMVQYKIAVNTTINYSKLVPSDSTANNFTDCSSDGTSGVRNRCIGQPPVKPPTNWPKVFMITLVVVCVCIALVVMGFGLYQGITWCFCPQWHVTFPSNLARNGRRIDKSQYSESEADDEASPSTTLSRNPSTLGAYTV